MSEGLQSVAGEGFSTAFDERGNLQEIRLGDQAVVLPVAYTQYELDGELCEVRQLQEGASLSFRLVAGESSGTLSIASGKEVALHLEPDQEDGAKEASLTVFVPVHAMIHLAEHRNIGRRIDREMPVGETYRCKLTYNFLLIDAAGTWIRFRASGVGYSRAEVEIARHPEMFALTFKWPVDVDAYLAAFASMQEALADSKQLIERTFGIRKLRDESRRLPEWLHNVKLVITADMMRSNWEITHDYGDVLKLARELKAIGCAQDTLFYIPGWQGAYDSTHPTYWPHPELGGEATFRAMVDGLHEGGFRVMIHSTGWGIDPYHPDIDGLDKLVMRDEDGDYRGWQVQRKWHPAKRSLRFRTERIPVVAKKGAKDFTFETVTIPDRCEALTTLGGVDAGQARIRLTVDRRRISSPPGWFAAHSEYRYPFPLLLQPGENQVRVEVIGEGEPDWEGSWFQVRYCFTPLNPYNSWTWPILMADMSAPEFQEVFIKSISTVVREFGIDAVHVDATFFHPPEVASPARGLLYKLREALPGIPICGEAVLSFEALGYWALSQGARQGLIDYPDVRRPPSEQGSLPAKGEFEARYRWLNNPSPVCSFAKDYCYDYPHLCAANAFVPVGKVCNIFPPRRTPRTSAEQWNVLREARRLDHIPGLRVNYREYGLDDETRAAILELAR